MATTLTIPPSLEGTRLSTDLTGRQVDILIAQGLNFVDRDTEVVELAFGDKEREIAGPQKLIQRWFISFLTKIGSVPTFPNYGTNFVRSIELGRIITDADVRIEFAEAAALVEDILGSDVTSRPDDERLDQAELVRFELSKTKLNLTVRIVSQAGEGATVILPIPLEV